MRSLSCTVFSLMLCVAASSEALACCFFGPPPTLGNEVAAADSVGLAVLVEAWPGPEDEFGIGLFDIIEVGPDPNQRLRVGARVVAPVDFESLSGPNYLILGSVFEDEDRGVATVDWSAIAVSPAAYYYALKSPSLELDARQRMPYFLKHFDDADPQVAADALQECRQFTLTDWRENRSLLSRDAVLRWLDKDRENHDRRGLCFQMLAMVGQPNDARLMQDEVFTPREDLSARFDVVTAWLFHSGESALKTLIDRKLNDAKVSEDEKSLVLSALSTVALEEQTSLPKERISQTFRDLLTRGELQETAISLLAEVQDWSAADQLLGIYRRPQPEASEAVKEAIIRYFVTFKYEESGRHAGAAQRALRDLRKLDEPRVAPLDVDEPGPSESF